MKNIVDTLVSINGPFALATIVSVWNSAPQPAGTSMAVDSRGNVIGGLTGGCIEADVHARCMECIETGVPNRITYGVTESNAAEFGLTCGGSVEVYIQRISENTQLFKVLNQLVVDNSPATLALVSSGRHQGNALICNEEKVLWSTGDEQLDRILFETSTSNFGDDHFTLTEYDCTRADQPYSMEISTFSFTTAPSLVILGSNDHAIALSTLGKFMGFRVVVCDVRPAFTTAKRFPDADEIVVEWPDEYLRNLKDQENNYICVLTHDTRFDANLLEIALQSKARYVGAMGSRRVHTERVSELQNRGIEDKKLALLHSPIGLDLAALGPREVAVSIMSEIITEMRGGTGLPMSTLNAQIRTEDMLVST